MTRPKSSATSGGGTFSESAHMAWTVRPNN
jgi:hypothetical protein